MIGTFTIPFFENGESMTTAFNREISQATTPSRRRQPDPMGVSRPSVLRAVPTVTGRAAGRDASPTHLIEYLTEVAPPRGAERVRCVEIRIVAALAATKTGGVGTNRRSIVPAGQAHMNGPSASTSLGTSPNPTGPSRTA
jgi:hypothetical protein